MKMNVGSVFSWAWGRSVEQLRVKAAIMTCIMYRTWLRKEAFQKVGDPSTCRRLAATSLSTVFGDRCRDDMPWNPGMYEVPPERRGSEGPALGALSTEIRRGVLHDGRRGSVWRCICGNKDMQRWLRHCNRNAWSA
jgi:hypothetical protein